MGSIQNKDEVPSTAPVPVPLPIESTFTNQFVFQHILSFVGDNQYRFVAGVNRTFHDAYIAIYPAKESYCCALTMEIMMFCYPELSKDERCNKLCKSAMIHNNIEGLEFFKSNGYTIKKLPYLPLRIVVMKGCLSALKFAHDNGTYLDPDLMIQLAAQYNQINILEWLYAIYASKFGTTACEYAARGGHLHVLKWLRQHNCRWDSQTCSNAAMNGHFELLQWAREHDCSWDSSTCSFAAQNGDLKMLQWARDNGCPWDSETCTNAAEGCHFEVLQWAHTNGCPWDRQTCSFAAENGHFEMLKWARKHGCPWDEEICSLAIEFGNFEMLKWARANGCPWGEATCSSAAAIGNLDALQWAREHGCPWDEYTCDRAASHGHLHILQWAHANGCPWDENSICIFAKHNADDDALEWLASIGYHRLIY